MRLDPREDQQHLVSKVTHLVSKNEPCKICFLSCPVSCCRDHVRKQARARRTWQLIALRARQHAIGPQVLYHAKAMVELLFHFKLTPGTAFFLNNRVNNEEFY